MDKQIQKLKKLVDLYFDQQREDIYKIWKKPSRHSDNEVWFYSCYRWGIFRDEIAFIFQEDKVVDISITRYFLWIEYQCIFYYQHEPPEYKIIRMFK